MLRRRKITLSLPQELISELHQFVKKRGISRFVEEAIVDRLKAQKHSREQQYIEAAQDEDRNQTFADWEQFSADGLNNVAVPVSQRKSPPGKKRPLLT